MIYHGVFFQNKSLPKLNLSNGDYSLIKQFNTVEHLGCYLDSNLIGESVYRKGYKTIYTKLDFSCRKSLIVCL